MPLAANGILIGLSANCVCLWSVDIVAGSTIVSFRPEAAHETACEEADNRSAWDSLFAAFDASQSGGRCEFRISSRCIRLSLRLARRTAKTTQGKGHGRPYDWFQTSVDAPVLDGAPAASTRALSDHRIRSACTRADMHFNSFVCIAKCFNDRSIVHFNVEYSEKSSPKWTLESHPPRPARLKVPTMKD